MTQLRVMAGALCGTMVLSAALLFLAPERGKKMMRFAVRIFFLLSILAPVAALTAEDFAVSGEWEVETGAQELEALAQQQLERTAARLMEEKAENILAENGAPGARASVSIHIADDQRISIIGLKIRVSGEEAYAAAAAAPALYDALGVNAELVTADGDINGDGESGGEDG